MSTKQIKLSKDLIKKSEYSKFQDFHNLMAYRVTDILLVSSLYDSYVFEEDGRLYELIRKEYLGLNLSHSPELYQISNAFDALDIIKREDRFKLIVVTMHIEGMSSADFVKKLKEENTNIPVVMIGYDNKDLTNLLNSPKAELFDKIFVWQGDYRLLVGIIKFVEDRKNIEHDVKTMGVQVILVVEDNVRYYSSFLPVIYTELLKQSQNLLDESINYSHKFLRMRARPKIILCSTYEEAMAYYKKYRQHILGIITDVGFKLRGKKDPNAGFKLTKKIKAEFKDIPIIIQSNQPDNAEKAHSIGASFLYKSSPTLLNDLRKLMKDNFSFGDFIFRNNNGEEVARAKNLTELEDRLRTIPEESLIYHANRNHFSNWLKARTEFYLAHLLRPQKVSDFKTPKDLRDYLIHTLSEFRINRQRAVISEFKKETFDFSSTFCRIGGGSIGGKARGLAFFNSLLYNLNIRNRFEGVEIFIPSLVVIATDVFDEFLEKNNLLNFALNCTDDNKLVEKFLNAEYFPQEITDDIYELLSVVHSPLAVRSSSLLEDSQGQPFAGVYETIMLPNIHPDIHIRVAQLLNAVKHIYASTFYNRSKEYIKMTAYRTEEEKMAVIIQKLEGNNHNGYFYPEISGVARSYNFYPTKPAKSKDGIVSVALGLGKMITDGGSVLRFSPKYPNHILQLSSVKETLKYSQREFFALNMVDDLDDMNLSEDKFIKKLPLSFAEKDGVLNYTASTYSPENNMLYDGASRKGIKLFTLAPILKHKLFPLPEIVKELLKVAKWGTGSEIEIEFAINLSTTPSSKKQFAVLQMRPVVIENETIDLKLNETHPEDIICKSIHVLGNGLINNIKDILLVDKKTFKRAKSKLVADEIAKLNSALVKENIPYLLIGMGRWGSLDPWLGIPVTWEQINGAKAIVETSFEDMDVEPSQGSHFFQNLTSFKICYFTIDPHDNNDFLNWEWLQRKRAFRKMNFVKHIRLGKPLVIKINGKTNTGVILKSKNR